ncbi:MAG: hypothetical protein ABIO72_01130 [Patescibacteria group bacterium]
MKKYLATLSLLALVGAGCDKLPQTTIQIPSLPSPQNETPAINGFGMLPALSAPGAVLGTPEAISARPMAVAMPVPSPVTDAAMKEPAAMEGYATVATIGAPTPSIAPANGKAMIRPFPVPQPAKVDYVVKATLPTWGSDGDVLRAKSASLPTVGLKALALATGLPSQTIGDKPDLRSFNMSWKDTEGLTWSFDSIGRTLSFWKETDYRVMQPQADAKIKQPTPLSDDEITAIANDFMTRHGFGTYAQGKPTIDHPWNAGDDIATPPCPVMLMKTEAASGNAGSGGGTVSSDMMPTPCGYSYPLVTSISYPSLVNGQATYDMGGYPSMGISLQIDLNAKQVTNGYLWLSPDTDSSKYPLIAPDEALKRLSAGGRNPLYWYGDGSSAVHVTIDSISLAWMRYDSWDNDGVKTFFLPALRATGTTDAGKGQTDIYQTVVPLVSDGAFGGATPPPIMLPMTDPAAPAVAPAIAPKPATTR